MVNFKQFLAGVSLSVAMLAALPLASASAATAPSTELKSTSFSSYCLDIYHGSAVLDQAVRLYGCTNSNDSLHVSINVSSNNTKFEQIYYRPTLCVGDLNGSAALLSCSSSVTNMTETSVNGKGIVTFKYSAGLLTAVKPSSTVAYPQLKFQAANSKTAGQEWDILSVK